MVHLGLRRCDLMRLWHPGSGVVAISTGRNPICFGELGTVNVFMAVLALAGRRLEVRIDQLGPHIGRLVAIHAGGSSMRAQQREGRLGMIKSLQIFP